jgi:organic radical activating enzyme
MSDYNADADKAEKQLKMISPTMCYAKWAQVSLHLTNGLGSSCYHPPLHKIDPYEILNDPSALHNTRQKKQERTMMLKGAQPRGCSYCWDIEKRNERSDRVYKSGEYWAQDSRKEIFSKLDTDNIDPTYVEVNFNQACNLSCAYCSPHLSSTWEQHIQEKGDYEIYQGNKTVKHNNLEALNELGFMPLKVAQKNNPYITAFWNWWPKLYKSLQVFRITGGEPLMDSNTYKILDYVYNNPNRWLELSITTNFSPNKKELMDKFLQAVKKLEKIQIWEDKERFNPGSGNHWYVNPALKNFALFISVDNTNAKAEYVRDGLNFNYMVDNVYRFLQETNNTTVTFINTFSVFSVCNTLDYLKFILDLRTHFSKNNQTIVKIPIQDPYTKHPDYEYYPRQRIWFDIPLLRNPKWMAVNILPESIYSKNLENAIDFMKTNTKIDNFNGFYDFEIAKMERNLQFLKTNSNAIDRANFAKFFVQYDKKRNKNLCKMFPELKDFFLECQHTQKSFDNKVF